MITCSNLAQKCAVQVCHVAAIVIETAQIVTAVLVSGCIVRSAQSQLKLLGFCMFIQCKRLQSTRQKLLVSVTHSKLLMH